MCAPFRVLTFIKIAVTMSAVQSPPFPPPISPPAVAAYAPPPARWKAQTRVEETDRIVAANLGVSPVVVAVARGRGHADEAAIRTFLEPGPHLLRDAALLPDIEIIVARLIKALENDEQILVFGDYDVDGVTSTALAVRTLRCLGARVGWRLPERDEGYGIRPENIAEAKTLGYDLILTVDCGITGIEAARRARELGIDLLITDHHECGSQLPEALAVVNPKRPDSRYPFQGLSGCGVVFKVMSELLRAHAPQFLSSFEAKFVDLVALSTIADCVPLSDENRYLVFSGLERLHGTRRKGLRALIETSSLGKKSAFGGGDIGFRLAPRLNAAGRLDSPTLALRLLLSDDANEAQALASQIEELNTQRKGITERALSEAQRAVETEADLDNDRLLVAVGQGWRRGVVGLIAAKLVDRYARPAFALNAHDGQAHGSGRSFADFDLHALLEDSRDLILGGGGHAGACGLTVATDRLPQWRAHALGFAASRLSSDDLTPTVMADCEIEGRDLTLGLAHDLARLEPCGNGNPESVLLLRGARFDSFWPLKNEHVKGKLNVGGRTVEWIWWGGAETAREFSMGERADLLLVPQVNEYRGEVNLQLVVKDARRAV